MFCAGLPNHRSELDAEKIRLQHRPRVLGGVGGRADGEVVALLELVLAVEAAEDVEVAVLVRTYCLLSYCFRSCCACEFGQAPPRCQALKICSHNGALVSRLLHVSPGNAHGVGRAVCA